MQQLNDQLIRAAPCNRGHGCHCLVSLVEAVSFDRRSPEVSFLGQLGLSLVPLARSIFAKKHAKDDGVGKAWQFKEAGLVGPCALS